MEIKKFEQGSEKNIQKIECIFNIKLPKDYKDFLIKNNGVNIEDGYFYVNDLKQKIMMGVLYGVDLTKYSVDIIRVNKEFEDDLLKTSLLIGGDVGGGWILLVLDGVSNGIWYYDHSYFFEQSSDELNTYFICDSFSDFLKLLETTLPS
jgi:hypothetical protein